jgi:hypothetical protein
MIEPTTDSSAHHVRPAPSRARAQRLYFEAPIYYRPQRYDPPSVFLAGGIVGVAEHWHARAVAVLQAASNPLVILNPNRRTFPIDDLGAAFSQVSWEQHHLHLADVTAFWFAASDCTVTTQPIAMFELGQALGEGRRLVVGASPAYPREPDVHMLCQLARPGLPVFSDLDDVVAQVLVQVAEVDRRRWPGSYSAAAGQGDEPS